MGDDSIESKQKNTISQIEKRLKSQDPNELVFGIVSKVLMYNQVIKCL